MSEPELDTGPVALPVDAPPVAPKRRNILRRTYDWTIHWADTSHAQWALFCLAFVESSFFPIPPDVLLIAMALAAPKRSLRYALICTVGSVAGGCLGYYIGYAARETVADPIIRFYGAEETFNRILAEFGKQGFLYVFIAALTPIPYKVFTIAAGVSHEHVSLQALILASIAGRGLRFFGLAFLFYYFGPPIKKFIDKYFNLLTVAFVVVAALGVVATKLLYKSNPQPPQPPTPKVENGLTPGE